MKKILLFVTCIFVAATMFSSCSEGKASSEAESSAVSTRKSSHNKSQASSTMNSMEDGNSSKRSKKEKASSDTESVLDSQSDVDSEPVSQSEANSPVGAGGLYGDNGFTLKTSTFVGAPEGLGGSPLEPGIVFLINNTTDGSIVMSTERTDTLIFSAEYEVDSDISGTLMLVVTAESGVVYTRENKTDFAKSGTNTFEALIKTDGDLSGNYTLQWYIDGMLACDAEFTK